METPVPPQVDPPVHIATPGSGHPSTLNPAVIEVDDHQDAFFIPRAASLYEAFGPTTNEVEKKVRAIEENLKAIESTDALGLDAA